MDKMDLKKIIHDYPDCVTNGAKLKGILLDTYPDISKAIVNTLVIMANSGIAKEIRDSENITELDKFRWQQKLEDEGFAEKIIFSCLNMVFVAFGLDDDYIQSDSRSTNSLDEYKILKDGNHIYFGSYPQTKVSDSKLTTELNNLVEPLPTNLNSQKWTSYGYYKKNSCANNFMWYIDVEYCHEKYRGVYFTSFRPNFIVDSSSASNSYQYRNHYHTTRVYYFKYEPIKWQILEESNDYATILADLALDSQQYYHSTVNRKVNGHTVYANNYAESEIRVWLNDMFYNTAFNNLQKALIQTVTVDNSALSTGYANHYACGDTNDKIWLLSYTEAFEKYLHSNSARVKKSSDYAKSQGADIASNSDNCYWWLRSPYCSYDNSFFDSSCCVRYVYPNGSDGRDLVCYTSYSVVPALKIKFN